MTTCDICGKDVSDSPWIILNRYALGTGKNRCMTACETDGECVWEIGPSPSDDACSGHAMCWPGCLRTYIEAKMVEVDYKVRGGK